MTIPTDLDRRFREAAEREGLVDVAYDVADSPIGDLLVAATDRGLCRIAFRPDAALDELAADFGTRVLKLPKRLDRVRRELDEYFAGRDTSSIWRPTSPPSRRSTSRCCTSSRVSRSAR